MDAGRAKQKSGCLCHLSYGTPTRIPPPPRVVMCIVSVLERDPPKDAKKRPLTREMLNEVFSTWMDGPITRGMIELIMDQPTPQLQRYALYEHRSTSTYARGPVCTMGDAAHAATPWQASGGGQAFEDAMILGALLGCVRSSDQLSTAFEIFDEVRRPRTQRILDSSRESGIRHDSLRGRSVNRLGCGENAAWVINQGRSC